MTTTDPKAALGGYEATGSEPQNHPHPGRGEGELLPCPFCGVTPRLTFDDDKTIFYCVQCENDDCLDPVAVRMEREEAIAAWNRRAPSTYGKGERGELRRAESEVEGAMRGLTLLPDDFVALEALWPASKRGSRAEQAYRIIKDRVEGITAYTRDALQALQPIGGRRG